MPSWVPYAEQAPALVNGARWQTAAVAVADDRGRKALLRRGFALEYVTLAWNVAGIVVLAIAGLRRGRWRWLASASIR